MTVKEFSDDKLIGNLNIMLEELENRLIYQLNELNDTVGITDDDLYFISDMLSLTRSYSNLLPELLKIGKTPETEKENA